MKPADLFNSGISMSQNPVTTIDHVQLAMPAGGEDAARRFYRDLLGMVEVLKPPELAKRGGAWFKSHGVEIHLGVEKDFRPAQKAHPAFRCSDYPGLTDKLRPAGVALTSDDSVPWVTRCHLHDPFGNRIELISEALPAGSPLPIPRLVLASASPRRQQLLRNAGIAFEVQTAEIPETARPAESPQAFVARLAREKAEAVFESGRDSWVLGADTIVVVDNQILGKPRDVTDAARMLWLLSGRIHRVITGVCLLGPARNLQPKELTTENPKLKTDLEDIRSETTLVTMSELTEKEIQAYIATGEPMDKAGAYAIQGIA